MHPLLATVALAALTAADAPKDGDKAKETPSARATITAQVTCLHCTYGIGDGCAACMKIDDKTPVILTGKVPDTFLKARFGDKVAVAEGTLSVDKDKHLVFTVTDAHFITDEDKNKAPAKGEIRVVGKATCAHCDLKQADECTLAIVNGTSPIVLSGKKASECAEQGKDAELATVEGKPSVDKKGVLRVEATKVEFKKK